MKVFIGCDHGGLDYKNALVKHLMENDYEVIDLGLKKQTSVDYPDYAAKVCEQVLTESGSKGILICGTGIGMSIAANKFAGIRAALVGDSFSAKATREHNNTNILCLGQRVIGEGLALLIADSWLETEFLGKRHQMRLDKIKALEEK